MKLTAIIIAKNEENMIADCLETVSFCDEIIVVDSGSTDRTADIAERFGAKVVKRLNANFSELRNGGLMRAKGEWILYIDADERVSSELKTAILHAVQTEKEYAAFKIERKNFYLGNNPWPKIELLERLFRKNKLKKWYGELHESPQVEGEIGSLTGFLLHYTHRDLTQMLQKTIIWSKTEAQLRFEAHHPKMTWWRFPRVMLSAFLDSYIQQKGIKAGTVGLIESYYQAFSAFVTYARLWEMQNSKSL